jgi:hypothetical protein
MLNNRKNERETFKCWLSFIHSLLSFYFSVRKTLETRSRSCVWVKWKTKNLEKATRKKYNFNLLKIIAQNKNWGCSHVELTKIKLVLRVVWIKKINIPKNWSLLHVESENSVRARKKEILSNKKVWKRNNFMHTIAIFNTNILTVK